MTHSYAQSTKLIASRSFANHYPTNTVVTVIFAIAAVALYIARAGRILQIVIPICCMILGCLTITANPANYIQLVMWTWFLAPFVRRVVDGRCGFADQNLILLSPLMVALAAVIGILRCPSLDIRRIMPFLLCLGALSYGVSITIILDPSKKLLYAALEWGAPIIFGLFLSCYPERFDLYRNVICSTFLLSTLILSIYGLYQFYAMPNWDVYWLKNVMDVAGANTFGRAEPGKLRVWSTLNAPGTFAIVLVAGMFFSSFTKGYWKILAIVMAFINLALTLVRTAWLGFAVALFVIVFSIGLKKIHKLVFAFIGVVILFSAIGLIPQAREIVIERISSFSDPGSDVSYQDRRDLYKEMIHTVLTNPLGSGHLSQQSIDSGILELILSLGWPGTCIYLGAIIFVLANPRLYSRNKDIFLRCCHAIALALLSILLSGNSLIDLPGAILWICIALYLTGHNAMRTPVLVHHESPIPVRSSHDAKNTGKTFLFTGRF